MQEPDNDELYLSIFLSGGEGPLQKEVDEFIETKLGHEVVTLQDAPAQHYTNLEILEQETDECSFAVLVLAKNATRTRENLLHEIGYCQGTFGRENVLVLRQDGVEEFAGITGILYEVFAGENVKSTFPRIRAEIEAAIARFEGDDGEEE